MYDEIEIREIIFDAQNKLDRLFSGLKVVVTEDETVATEKDVFNALRDRQKVGLGANDEPEFILSSDPMLHSRPSWLSSSRISNIPPVFNSAVESVLPEQENYFRRVYSYVLSVFRNFFKKQEPTAAPVISKHKNKVYCRVFKDGVSL